MILRKIFPYTQYFNVKISPVIDANFFNWGLFIYTIWECFHKTFSCWGHIGIKSIFKRIFLIYSNFKLPSDAPPYHWGSWFEQTLIYTILKNVLTKVSDFLDIEKRFFKLFSIYIYVNIESPFSGPNLPLGIMIWANSQSTLQEDVPHMFLLL